VKYTGEGKILLGCRRRGDKLRIEVRDTGPGIPELELQAIFEEFHQLDNPARERSKGLGLGLAIVLRLADLLGHNVDVRSRVGVGSVFAVEVPLGRAGAADVPELAQEETHESASSIGTILVVEDDPAVRELLQQLLDDEGHCPLVAADGRRALELAAQGAVPNLVIADYNLPNGLNGLQVIASLRKQIRRAGWRFTVDRDFTGVMRACAEPTPERPSTWISEDFVESYAELHRRGFAHSVEVWEGEELVGGLYGVTIGGFFGGESMFRRRTDASKAAVWYLVEHLRTRGFTLLDAQVPTPHLESLGAVGISRDEYLRRLRAALVLKVSF